MEIDILMGSVGEVIRAVWGVLLAVWGWRLGLVIMGGVRSVVSESR